MLRPHVETDAHDRITSFEVHQEVPAEHPVARPHRLAVAGYDVVDGPDGEVRLERVVRVELDVDGATTPVEDLLECSRPALLLVNDDDLAYAKVRLDPRSLDVATGYLHAFGDSLPRTLVLNAAWDMTRDGEWGARRYVELVLGTVAHETDSTVVLVLLRQLTTALDLYVAMLGTLSLWAVLTWVGVLAFVTVVVGLTASRVLRKIHEARAESPEALYAVSR